MIPQAPGKPELGPATNSHRCLTWMLLLCLTVRDGTAQRAEVHQAGGEATPALPSRQCHVWNPIVLQGPGATGLAPVQFHQVVVEPSKGRAWQEVWDHWGASYPSHLLLLFHSGPGV